ncbi:MAG: alpha-amylase family glycosyl hydrolase [Geminicoccaceae bacterium]
MASRRRAPYLHLTPRAAVRKDLWWKGAVIYQIYPRSFQDTDGDGVGDLRGIARHLDYVARLGVDAIWISPFCKSPMKDFGYDVADYCAVDPLFGTLEDLDALLAEAHRLGLKVMMDFVPSHTSDRHPWFLESRQSRDNPKADWYVWADPRPDGTPPSNWLSVFGGSAWEWDPRRGQYYLHNFLKQQPDLDFHRPEVIAALLDQARFWLDRGIDGFRVDAIDYGAHDPALRDNPPRRRQAASGSAPGSPYGMQLQRYNKARPELVELFLKPLHALTERYPGKVLLGEISGDEALLRAAEYTNGGGLDIVYTFDLLTCPGDARSIARVVSHLEREIGDGWACWSLGNHDVRRAVSRWGGADPPEGLRRLLPVLLGSLRGTICLYQGEELGLGQAELAYEQLKDPFGLAFWPAFAGRDGCRTPMPWAMRAPAAGFTTGDPWLPVPDGHRRRAVDVQAPDPNSVLNTTRAFLDWRRERQPLLTGAIRFRRERGGVLAFERANEADCLLCAFNLGPEEQLYPVGEPVLDAGFTSAGARVEGRGIRLPAWGYAFAHLE